MLQLWYLFECRELAGVRQLHETLGENKKKKIKKAKKKIQRQSRTGGLKMKLDEPDPYGSL